MALLKIIIRRISIVGNWIGMSVLVLMMLLIVTNIITRSFGRVITPAYELIEIMAGIAISFCIVYVTLEKGNIVVDFVVTKLPRRLQSVLHVITSLLGMGTWILIAVASFIFANRLGFAEKTDLLGISIMPIRYVWIFALVVLCFIIFVQLVDAIGKVISKWTQS